ncbi:MAG: alpha/beta-hydrolase family protein [Ilumatobacteraceae bacterium]
MQGGEIEQADDGATQPSRIRRIGRAIVRRPVSGGLVVGLFLWCWSLTPTLMPRTWVTQAAVGAVCATVGYAFGTLVSRIVWAILRRRGTTMKDAWWRRLHLAIPVLAAVAVIVGSPMWLHWQNRQRDLFAMEHLGAAQIVPMLLATVVVGAILFTIGRLIGAAVRGLGRFNQKHLPRVAAQPVTVVLVIVLAVFVLRDVAFRTFVGWADSTFSLVDTGTPDGVSQPQDATVSGSPQSLVQWDDLGYQGRAFVAGTTSEATMHDAWGTDAALTAPVRAYAGIRSADDVDERAKLAVDDLERAGGFDREVLVVATATGTGWIDPDAAEALEVMYRGDTAIVSMQYSFLPSWIAFITDLDRASVAGATLFAEVERRWQDLPADHRPKLLVFGLSLGSYGAEGAFAASTADASVANMTARTDGVLLAGGTNGNPILRQVTAKRGDGSPVWAPIYDDGTTVRFATRDPKQPQPAGAWDEPRILYVNHPSDPVTYWGVDWLWSRPEWMDDPRGYDVTGDAHWFPFVTWAQGVFDLMAGFGAPPGHGHDYRLDYVSTRGRRSPRPTVGPMRRQRASRTCCTARDHAHAGAASQHRACRPRRRPGRRQRRRARRWCRRAGTSSSTWRSAPTRCSSPASPACAPTSSAWPRPTPAAACAGAPPRSR